MKQLWFLIFCILGVVAGNAILHALNETAAESDRMTRVEADPVPANDETTANPTTANPTTANPTTANPTTANPTTANPTTTNPTTTNPTTANPTTTNPTTTNPTTTNPTTTNPTTANPTTANPTTANPENVTITTDTTASGVIPPPSEHKTAVAMGVLFALSALLNIGLGYMFCRQRRG